MSLTFNAMDIQMKQLLVKTLKYRLTTIYFLGFYKKKFEFSFEFALWPLLSLKCYYHGYLS